jgi:hypothetical protein
VAQIVSFRIHTVLNAKGRLTYPPQSLFFSEEYHKDLRRRFHASHSGLPVVQHDRRVHDGWIRELGMLGGHCYLSRPREWETKRMDSVRSLPP